MATTHFNMPSSKSRQAKQQLRIEKPASPEATGVGEGTVVGVRRTHTFTSTDKRRNTVAGPRGVMAINGNGDTSSSIEASKALIRAPNMDNIVE